MWKERFGYEPLLAEHRGTLPVAMIEASQNKGEGERYELKAAQKILCKCGDLANTVITADALSTQKETTRAIVDRGGAIAHSMQLLNRHSVLES